MKLIIEDDEGRKTVVPFVRDEISIGRLEGNTIRLTERNVSRHHARLLKESNAIIVEDLGSANGVRINGERIDQRSHVRDGDLIEIGDYDLAIEGLPANNGDTNPSFRLESPEDTLPPARKANGANGSLTNSDPAAGTAPRPLSAADAPRLVGLAGDFYGQELKLPSTNTVVGRPDDGSDIHLDHPSVSRRHARFVREGDGAWRVYDLGSANGVRVNDELRMSSLVKPGDSIELGHVAFRFTASSETFVPARSSAAASKKSAAAAGPSRAPLLGLLAVVALLVVAGIAIVPRLTKEKVPEVPREDFCQQAQGAIVAQNWELALARLGSAKQAGDSCSFPLDAALETAQKNLEVKTSLDQAEKLLVEGNFQQAFSLLQAVPAGSPYASEAKLKLVEARARAVKQVSDRAHEAIERGQLDQADSLLRDLTQLDPEAATLPLLQKDLAGKRRSADYKPAPALPPPTVTPKAPPAVVPVAAPVRTMEDRNSMADAEIADGIKLIKAGDFKAGIERLQSAIAEQPEKALVARAHRNIGAAYARVNRPDDAIPHLKIYLRLQPDAPEREQVSKLIQDLEARKSK